MKKMEVILDIIGFKGLKLGISHLHNYTVFKIMKEQEPKTLIFGSNFRAYQRIRRTAKFDIGAPAFFNLYDEFKRSP